MTDVAIRQAKPKAMRYEIKDFDRPGFRLTVYPSGTKSFCFRYWLNGKYKKTTIGEYPRVRLTAAVEAYKAHAESVAKGIDPQAAKKRARDPDGTVTALTATYEKQHLPTLADGTAAYYKAELRRMVDAFGSTQASNITKPDAVKFVDKASDRGLAAAMQAHKIAVAFFSWLVERGHIEDSPCANLKPPGRYVVRERTLDDAELLKVWRGAEAVGGAVETFAKLAILTGCRRDEIAYLTWDEIKTDKIEIPGDRTKNSEPHSIPITSAIRGVLDMARERRKAIAKETEKEPGAFVVTGTDKGMGGHSQAKRRLDKAVTGIKPWRFHDLRRTFSTKLAPLGVRLEVAERCLNHISGTRDDPLVKAYHRHDYAPQVKEAFELWSGYVESLLEEKRAAA